MHLDVSLSLTAKTLTFWNHVAKQGTVELDDEQSIIEMAKSNPAALAILYKRHYKAIAGFVRHRVGNEHEADDIISDVFLAMVKNLPRYRFRGIPFRIWLFRIATSQLSRWAKRRRRQASRQLAMEVDGKSTEPRKTGSSGGSVRQAVIWRVLPLDEP